MEEINTIFSFYESSKAKEQEYHKGNWVRLALRLLRVLSWYTGKESFPFHFWIPFNFPHIASEKEMEVERGLLKKKEIFCSDYCKAKQKLNWFFFLNVKAQEAVSLFSVTLGHLIPQYIRLLMLLKWTWITSFWLCFLDLRLSDSILIPLMLLIRDVSVGVPMFSGDEDQ